MSTSRLSDKAAGYLQKLCLDIPSRPVGSPGNRVATAFFAGIVAGCGFETECPTFTCIDWTEDGVTLSVDGASFAASASPYSLGCQVSAPLVVVSTVEELKAVDTSNAILLMREEIAREQLMPKNFPFYNPDSHKRIIRLLEAKNPYAIIAATSRDAAMVGNLYPFPLIEDGDFNIPSVYMADVEGRRLADYAGQNVVLESRAHRILSQGCNVVARKGDDPHRRVVVFAHIDAKRGTPGACDNAGGVIVLLLLAELLATYDGSLGVEIVAMNGEDYFSNPGEQQYLASNAGRFNEIVLGINVDGVGYHKGKIAYSLYDCPTDTARSIRTVLSAYEDIVEGELWYQGDHGLFLMNQRPALAFTSERVDELMADIIHTPNDRPDIMDATKLVILATALRDVVLQMEGLTTSRHTNSF